MINVYPKLELTVNHIFKDSKGKRQSLHPAESLGSIKAKEPQIFDESDPLVAEMILSQVKAKTVRIDSADTAKLKATIAKTEALVRIEEKAEAARISALEAEGKKGVGESVKKAVAAAHAEYKGFVSPKDQEAAIEKAVAEATSGDETEEKESTKD